MEAKDLKILICDDSVLVRSKMKKSFEKLGCTQLFEAGDGVQAVEMYNTHKPELVLVDIVMPVLDGIGALKAIKAIDSRAIVVMASSVGTEKYIKEAITAKADEFLQKPIEQAQIEKLLKKVLEILNSRE